MQFLKILFWSLLAFVAAVFTFGNWTNVTVQLFGGLVAEVNLPLLLLVTFLLGFVPTLVYQHWVRFRLRQRLTAAERATESALAAVRGAETPAAHTPPAAPATGAE
ncbi:lipopolysaccharide assembly protein LapA domain-containing protein [Sphingomonas sp. 8AM]|uniref:lipopolysaccharide assembly protein LapA domain-containing protein n=1 Tax=Sphingomonas sp. 8AM TaxID=2653170 RepID=UPI0012F33E86|nr:lipopolysaccharide assembly protein LapA domain-containing protein [Sphingomonas sp. 8AM]VXD02595.1 conserved hypothetical protein [Sphingomonas sp. 8AM]